MTTKNKPNNNLLDSSSYGTLNPISKTTQISKNPRTGMRSSTDTTTPADPLQTARDAERNKFIASATNKEKLRLVNIELYDSIKTYNKSLGQLIIETGLLKKAVTNIFGLDYINYREEIYKMFPDANLQSSGVNSGPEFIPILTVQEIEQLLAYYTNIHISGLSGNDQITIMINKIEDNKKAVLFKLGKIEEIRDIFSNISATKELLKKIFAIINEKMSAGVKGAGQWGVWNISGKNITLADIIDVLTKRYPTVKGGPANTEITQICVLVINMLTTNINIVPVIDKEASENLFAIVSQALEIIFQGLVGTSVTIPSNSNFWKIRDALIGFLNQTQSNSWTFTNPNRQEMKDPDIKKSGDVADQTYGLIDQLGLTEEQTNTLINIIITLRSKTSSSSSETPEQKTARENKFVNDAQIQFIQLINTISKQNPDPGFMTRVFDGINNNMGLLNDIYDLIINPNPAKIQLIVRNIIDTLGQTLTPYEEKQPDFTTDTTSPELSLGSIVDEDVSQEALKFKDTRPQLKPIPYDAEIFIPFGHITPLPPRIEPVPTVLNTLINKVSSIFKEDIKKKNKKVIVKGKKSKDIEMTAIPTDALSNITDFLKEENKELSVNDINEVKEIIDENKNNKPLLTKIKKEFNTFKSKVGNFKIGMRYKVDGHLFETIEGAIAYINLREIAGDNIPEQRYGLLRYDPPDDEGDDEGDDGGGPPGGGRPGRGFAEPRRRRVVFNGLPKKKWLLLLIVIGLLSSGIITLDQIFKKDVKDDGTPATPTQQTPTPTPTDTTGTIVPINPPKKDDTYFQIQKTDFWESVGLSWIIDDYNSLVIRYNSLSPADKKNMDSTITKYYNRFAKLVNIPTLSELKMARQNYEMLMTQYQNAVSNGLDFNTVNNIYLQLQKSIAFLETMTDKYLALENAEGAPNLNKNDADITIDDVDANINQNTYLTTKLDTGKNKAIKDLLSKGMQARIARKLAGKSSLGVVDQELQLYNNYSLVKNDKNDGGLGNIYDNPLIRQNRRYEIKRYLKCNPNPQPFIVPSYRTMYNKSMRDRPILHNVIQIDNTMNYDTGNKLINQKLYSENPPPPQLAKSRLYNPEYHLEKINNEPIVENINNDAIGRSGPYYGLPLSYNQYYQYGNIQQKYNEDFNNYPIQKPIIDIKKSRVLPNSFSLK